jgi:hypothetical protein
MSGKIKAIAEQAKKSVPQGILTPDKWIEEYNRIFAELIVKECLTQVNASHPLEERSEWSQNSFAEETIKRKIKQHFGIKDENT